MALGPASYTILVVEDDANLRDSTRSLLEDEGYQVVTAIHGRDGLDVLAGGVRPDVILLDLRMRVLDGWQMLAAMQDDAELRALPVLVLSADPESRPRVGNVRGWLRKPIHLDKLFEAIARCCAERSGG